MPSAFADFLLQRPSDVVAPPRASIFRPAVLMQRAELLLDALTGCLSLGLTTLMMTALAQGDVLPGSTRHALAACLLFLCLLILFLNQTGTYRLTGSLLGLRETECVLRAVAYLFAIVIPCALLFSYEKSMLAILIEAPTLAILLVLEKQLLNRLHDWLPSLLFPRKRVVIYGPAASAQVVFSTLERSAKLRLLPVAVVTTDPAPTAATVQLSAAAENVVTHANEEPATCSISESMLRRLGADVVLITDPPQSSENFQHILQQSSLAGAQVALRASGSAQNPGNEVDYLDLDGQVVYGMVGRPTRLSRATFSRMLDLAIAGAMVLLVAPMLLLTALIIRLDSKGPVFFRQTRIGLQGKPFTIFKFRTMGVQHCGSGVSPSHSGDERITRVGRWLRRTSIDELPQLWNVLRGDMALVGPRPEMPFIVERYTPAQRERLDALPGLTGVWQISAHRSQPIHENVHYDLYYLKHQSPFFDIAILLHTVFFAMRGV